MRSPSVALRAPRVVDVFVFSRHFFQSDFVFFSVVRVAPSRRRMVGILVFRGLLCFVCDCHTCFAAGLRFVQWHLCLCGVDLRGFTFKLLDVYFIYLKLFTLHFKSMHYFEVNLLCWNKCDLTLLPLV